MLKNKFSFKISRYKLSCLFYSGFLIGKNNRILFVSQLSEGVPKKQITLVIDNRRKIVDFVFLYDTFT